FFRFQRTGGGDGVLVDGFLHRAHAAAPRTDRRAAVLFNACSTSSTSDGLDSWPKLTRNAAFASSGATRIAASTRLERTFPEDQAAPELIATPSRSMAMTAVSGFSPGSAKLDVFGRRFALAPNTMASAGRPASNRS